ncbi:MAG: hypothetical protein NVS2B3_11680 [Vulcanimicrobiaceae bacterium]
MLTLAVVGFSLRAAAAAATDDFGAPPPVRYPIIFNDRNFYARPDVLVRSRVLAALVAGGRIYVPLRSMFERMGATVSVTGGRRVTATKSGSTVTVTLGRAEVVINGETRPLDVPPLLERGVLLVPVRVISEALGAYVQWLPSRRVVVVRYADLAAPSPEPSAPPVPAPVASVAPAATPTPRPTAAARTYRGFVQGAYAAPRNYSEFSAGKYCPEAFTVSGAYTFANAPIAVKADFRRYAFVTSDNATDALGNHYTQFATIDGGTASAPVFLARQSTLDVRLEYRVAAPDVFIGVGYVHATNGYGYPALGGVGLGIEKLPDLRSGLRGYGSAFYYPRAAGTYALTDARSPNAGRSYRLSYDLLKYDIGVMFAAASLPVYAYGGYEGDRYFARENAPLGQTHDGPYVGLGYRF